MVGAVLGVRPTRGGRRAGGPRLLPVFVRPLHRLLGGLRGRARPRRARDPGRAGFEGARALGALAIPGGGQDSATRLGWMQALGATALVCTPSYALHLIEVARERGQDPSK